MFTNFRFSLLVSIGLLLISTLPLFLNFSINEDQTDMQQQRKHGIVGEAAPELSEAIYWIDVDGKEREPIQLSNYDGKFKVIYCFQSWCPGCHSKGLPALQKMTDALKDNDEVVFLAIQTVFEGSHINTQDKLLKTQQQYNLNIPFGHDVGDATTHNRSNTMYHYRTGGTPWFIFIDKEGKVVFNDFHIDVENSIDYLKEI